MMRTCASRLCFLAWLVAPFVVGPGVAWAGFSDGVSDDRLRLPSGPGSLEGVGENVVINPNMGVMQHRVPFELPAGFPGATPSLGLSYSSGSGSSEVGVGWSLSLPTVERMTARGLPRFTDADSFVADGGEELVKVDVQADFTVYRARFEGGFVRWLWHTPGANGYWEAQYPDGSRGFFGADHTGATVVEANVIGSTGAPPACSAITWSRRSTSSATAFATTTPRPTPATRS